MKKIWVFVFALLYCGCNEVIQISGSFINTLESHNALNCRLVIAVTNYYSNLLPNIKISILQDADSSLICPPKFSNNLSHITFSLPEEQTNKISKSSMQLIVVIEHPNIGLFTKEISLNSIEPEKPILIEFHLMNTENELPKTDAGKYKKFNYSSGTNY